MLLCVGSFLKNAAFLAPLGFEAMDVDLHAVPFAGTIPWEETMIALKEIGYTGDFNMEIDFERVPKTHKALSFRKKERKKNFVPKIICSFSTEKVKVGNFAFFRELSLQFVKKMLK